VYAHTGWSFGEAAAERCAPEMQSLQSCTCHADRSSAGRRGKKKKKKNESGSRRDSESKRNREIRAWFNVPYFDNLYSW
jgi:hypothetical protein